MGKRQFLILGIILFSLIPYLEWGGGHAAFIFQMEAEILSGLFEEPGVLLHPMLLGPLVGQLCLLYSIITKKYRPWALIGIGGLSILFILVLYIGISELNWYTVISVLPFFIFSVLFIFKKYE